MIVSILLGIFLLCVCLFLQKWVRKASYWIGKIPFVPICGIKSYLYGNTSEGTHVALQYGNYYKNYRSENNPILGIYTMFLKPALLIVDLQLIREILNKNFDHFQERGMFFNEKDDPLSAIPGTLDHDKWKPVRQLLIKAFTPARIRGMFPIMQKIGDNLIDGLKNIVEHQEEVEIRDLIGRFTADIIATIVIGIDCEFLSDSKTHLLEMLQKAMKSHTKFPWNHFMSSCPKLARSLHFRKHPKDVSDMFIDVVHQSINYRRGNDERRDDFLKFLIDENLSTNQIAAIVFDFLSAGYSDITSTLSYCLYELALSENEEIQMKARNEIQLILEQNELTLDALKKMTYIELILKGRFDWCYL